MGLKSFMPIFTGEMPHHRLYEFTPDEEHDPGQRTLALPRVLFVLDDFPINDGQAMLLVRDPNAQKWRQLPKPALRALGVVSALLVEHMEGVLTEAKSVTALKSETSIPEPHELFVPVHEREDMPKLWARTYTDDTRASADHLTVVQNRLVLPAELKTELDAELAALYWNAEQAQPTAPVPA